MNAHFNLPSGCSPRDIEGDQSKTICEVCGEELEGAEQFIMGLCRVCLEQYKDLLPE